MQIWLYYTGEILIFAGLAMSLNLLLGYAGQVSVAHAAFAAVGGYTMAYLVSVHHWNFVAAIVLGAVLAFVLGVVMSLPAMKLSVEYLILLTLAVSYVILGVFRAFPVLGGSSGLTSIPHLTVFGVHMRRPGDWVIPTLVLALVIGAACWRIGESAFGRVLKGLREDPQATQALGKNVFGYKVAVFGLTSGMAGLCGGMYSGWLGLATPSVYGFNFSLTIFAMVIFGGMANLTGSVLGALIVGLLEPVLRRVIHLEASRAALVQLIVYGVALTLLMRLRAQGVLPEGRSLWSLVRRKKADARVEMRDAEWVPDVAVSRAGGVRLAQSQDERDLRWRNAPIVLETEGVTKRFGGITAAEDLHIELRKGTITALVGPNGAGKTTVFNLLTGFIPPDAGSVKLNGVELVGLNPDRVARMGLVRSFQDVRLFGRITVLQNVLLAVQHQYGENIGHLFLRPGRVRARDKEVRDKAMESLTFVGMGAFADVPASALSYGQSKLVSLARVLATDAAVLLLDEPASGIDTKWVDTMLDLVEAVRDQGRTVCIVEHNLHVVGQLADHTYFMELGRITAEGTIDELTNAPRLAEAYFGTA
ncbi:MAG: branched-chain amino acid transport system ATP-binding protein livM [Acidimicrobiaceae bacterium]|jgi:branched-chain amino acid transport system permease protein|nr:branched-chain amino acid transport system ATP-binding protein livM [Acidimicrobiaceae bacterium]